MLAVHTQRGLLPSLAGCSAVAASSLAAMEAFSWAGPRRPSHPSHGATVLLGLGAFVALGGRFWRHALRSLHQSGLARHPAWHRLHECVVNLSLASGAGTRIMSAGYG